MSQALDTQWFERLRRISGTVNEEEWFRVYGRITHAERELFLNNEIENPRFSHKKKQDAHIYDGLVELDELVKDLNEQEKNPVVLDLYLRKIQKKQLRSALIAAAYAGNDKEFYALCTELYGKPKKKYFAYVAKRVTKLAKDRTDTHPAAAKRLQKLMSKIDYKNVDISADILPPVVTGGKIITSIAEVISIFQQTLNRLEITGWSIEVDESDKRVRFAVNAGNQVIVIPGEKQLLARPTPLTDVKIMALAEHEVGVHVRRCFEGSRSPLLLLQYGLDSHTIGEEGLAGYVQQQIEGADEFYGFDRYLAASLATGMDGQKRDFRAVFSLMTDYYTLRFNAGPKDEAPIHAAWNVCVRIFRGTTGKSAGTIFTKDIVYMEGNIGIWHLISEKPERFEQMFLGKFNPLLSRHVKSLQTLEILEQW